jgi:RNA polymerase sigma-70 factor (ECF subfamily)
MSHVTLVTRPGRAPTGTFTAESGGEAPDEVLMHRFQTGRDEAAFTALVHRYEHQLFASLHRHLGHREMAEEAFQETFLSVYRHAEQFDVTRPFRPWLFTIAANQARDMQRRAARDRTVHLTANLAIDDGTTGVTLVETVAAAGGPSAAALAEAAEAVSLVRAALLRLTEPQRRVVTLIFGEGRKYREAAAVLGIPVGTVKSRVHAALRQIAKMLAPLRPAPAKHWAHV